MVSPEAKITLILLCFVLSDVTLTGVSLCAVDKLSESEGFTLETGTVLWGFSAEILGLMVSPEAKVTLMPPCF